MKKLLVIAMLFTCAAAHAQNAKTDSLLNVANTSKVDTAAIKALNALAEIFRSNDADTSLYYAAQALKRASAIDFSPGIALAYRNMGGANLNTGNYQKAEKHYRLAIEAYQGIGDKKGIAACYHNIGLINTSKGNFPEALKNYFASLKVFEELGDKRIIAATINSIGTVYFRQNDTLLSMKYYLQALTMREELGFKLDIADSYHNIGTVYLSQEKYEKAIDNFFRAHKIYQEEGNKKRIASSFINIGTVHDAQNNYSAASANYLAALKIYEEIGDKKGNASILNNLGTLSVDLKKYDDAQAYLDKALVLAKDIGTLEEYRDTYNGLAKLHVARGDYKKALEYRDLYSVFKDSMLNEENNMQIAEMQTIYETEKKDNEITLLSKDKIIQEKEINKQKLVRNGFVGGFALTLLLAASIFFSLQQNKKKNRIISAQKKEVEEKNKHITESIEYALRIQTAILPPDKLVREYMSPSFILYLPKDIVAGDFYWMETVDDILLFAACDCTGHGVPGAMVSVMCHNALNRAVREYGITQPAAILDKVAELVQDNFTRSEEEIQDGMDASICAYYPGQMKLQWAGANNPLWIVRGGKLIEYKADKQPIGKYEYRKPYTNHEIELQKGDTIYVFSDGYADQFNAAGEKKLTKKGFKEILLAIQDKDMDRQREELKKRHDQWKGSTYQIDDICVIGMRV